MSGRRATTSWLAGTLLFGGCGGPEHVEAVGHAFVEHTAQGRFEQALELATPSFRSLMPPQTLDTFWGEIVLRHGALVAVGEAREESRFRATRVIVTVELERDFVEAAVDIDMSRRVAGLYYRKSDRPRVRHDEPLPAGVREISLRAGAADWPLDARLALPEGPDPPPVAMLMLSGAGPQDLDGTVGPNHPLRELAWGLAARGVATLRYDKRTRAHPARFVDAEGRPAFPLTPEAEVIEDALAGLALLRARSEVNGARLMLLGHSLGGFLAPRVAQRAAEQGVVLSGLVLLAAPARPLEQVILGQSLFLDHGATRSPDADKRIQDLTKATSRVAAGDFTADTDAQKLPLGLPAAYWLALRGYDPVAIWRATHLPALLMRGERDYQTVAEDLSRWRAAGGPLEIVELPGLNHLLLPGTGAPGPHEYREPGHVPPAVLEVIAAFARRGAPAP